MPRFVPSGKGRERLTYGPARDWLEMPDLLEVQRNSYEWFFQTKADPGRRKAQGLQELLEEVFPIESYNGSFALEFVSYYIDPPSISQEEACRRDLTWSSPVRATIRLINRKTSEIKEEEIYLGDFPVMTEKGSFIVNGTERVVVSQLSRSPGLYLSIEMGSPGQEVYKAKVIPDRGAWLDFDLTPGEILSVNIDNRRKVPATTLLKAFGVPNDDELLLLFGAKKEEVDLVEEEVRGKLLAEPVIDETGKVVIPKNDRITKEHLELLWNMGRTRVCLWNVDSSLATTLERDDTTNTEEAVLEIFRRMRPNEPVRLENAREYIQGLFFDTRRYNLGRVGRYKLNKRLGLDIPDSVRTLTVEDVVNIVLKLIALRDGNEREDDIDHLGNRRVRSVGELLQNQIRIGLLRMERIAKDRMTTVPDLSTATARDLVNVRPIQAAIREFFGSSQLSQFMDQTNPLAELTHRRRLSALGPGGLSRERAGFEARDVHPTHYGRICPIETPEGPNIGLVTSLAVYARVNEYGFLVTPKRVVVNSRVTDEMVYLSADEEEEYYVGRANEPVDEDGYLLEPEVYVRHRGLIVTVPREKVQFIDVSPQQIVSISTALIPFLENDDANRALMGSNMQRQAVPLIQPEAPLVGTGIESQVARDSGCAVIAKRSGVVSYVDAARIEVTAENGEVDRYSLVKFSRSNQGTVIHQRPIVEAGESVTAGDVIADGQSIDRGELALGRNVLVAFVSWEGYNFEDAVLVSERLVKEDLFTSIHVEEYEVDARDTKLGPEEITRDIPNVGEDSLKNLDENGLVRIGAEVKAGDILVGKVTPKGESEQMPEERLLRAIFGEKAREVRDTSLRIPHGEGGRVVAIKRLSRAEYGDELPPGVNDVVKVSVAQLRKITVGDKMAGRHGNKGVVSRILPVEDMPCMPDGTPVDVVLNPLGVPSRLNLGQVLETIMGFGAHCKGVYIATPVFEGANEREIFEFIGDMNEKYPGMTPDGCITLYDGRTGEPMEGKVTVGYMYMFKLIHLVDDKIHARSVGPYSLITQQPLGGKAQFGGQRFGEMEVWALEGYGAAHTLREMLTVKSDYIRGRLQTYERIVKGQDLGEPGIPESFRVLVKELQGLALDVEVLYDDGTVGDLVAEEEEEREFRLVPSSVEEVSEDVGWKKEKVVKDRPDSRKVKVTEAMIFGGSSQGDGDLEEDEA
ncbi:MAG: DNA-directed RNA polymerase subunit beta [Synergistales bacterium 54_24]|nr:MAG: DNA-directed RNA polymerase subunit beta [Synergistales bacterium 54_24]HAF49969.1 DNA-directed RNA polymerase subunit beta [Synergistaceae bacterium]